MIKKIKNFLGQIYGPFFRRLIIGCLIISTIIAFVDTVNLRNGADRRIAERKQIIDKKNKQAKENYEGLLNSKKCQSAKSKYEDDMKNKVRDGGGLLPISYYTYVLACPHELALASYETDNEIKTVETLKGKTFLSLFLDNMFVGNYSYNAIWITFFAILLILFLPAIRLIQTGYRQIRAVIQKTSKMADFQKYSLILFFAILIILVIIALVLLY